MQRTLVLALLASSAAFAQSEANHAFVTSSSFGFQKSSGAIVQGAPYSASITNESVQTLADGNRIVQTSTGTTARDSMGRTRQDAPLPPIGNMAPADAPHLVFLQDPVAQASYTLNLTDKTATKGPTFAAAFGGPGTAIATTGAAMLPKTLPQTLPPMVTILRSAIFEEDQAQTEDLGTKTMEGIAVTGTRTTHTIAAGQIGNDRPLSVVTEVWTSPELKTVVYSKRSDPRMGDQTFQLTNIVRSEPDPSLFSVPSDFKVIDAPGPILYKSSGAPAQ